MSRAPRPAALGLAIGTFGLGMMVLAIGLAEPAWMSDAIEVAILANLAVVNLLLVGLLARNRGQVRDRPTGRPHAEQIRQLVRDCSHDLRTPITIAKGHAELLWQASNGEEETSDIEVVLGELDRLAQLTDRLLTLSAADDPGFLALERLDPESIIVALVRRWSVVAPRDWKLSVHDDHPIVADHSRLTSALDALIENAVRHTERGDEIAIELRTQRGIVTIQVRDGGSGIPAGQVSRLLQEPARARVDGPRRSGGTGLGLAIVKAIAEAHGGWMSITSQPGEGSIFAMHLPRLTSVPMDGTRRSGPVAISS
jgi:signal transduction histidine kinase